MKMKSIRIVFLFILVQFGAPELRSQLYELPSLIVETDQNYLQKKSPTNLTCELSPGWSEARIISVLWLKDQQIILVNDTDYIRQGHVLTVLGVKQQNEGEYQCLADISKIRLSNRQLVTTNLISSPLKIRRTRMTKFDVISNHAITVKENEVARLPCAGIPDVVPGPATICFQRLEHEECLGTRNGTKYLTTNTGMQIALVQPSDAGFYHCVVRNEYTNQTRKSPKPVLLYVRELNATDKAEVTPKLLYPAEDVIAKPIDVHVAEGDDVIMECVMALSKIVWVKPNDTTPVITVNDQNSRFQQVWGNLRIKSVASGDSGIYSCLGITLVDKDIQINLNSKPRVDYNLIVYSPTSVRLSITPQMDKTYMLECLATNLRYEIPMAYVNGTSLINSISTMGIPSNTNFYTNPIRVQLQVKTSFSGSVQCISRPAMEEAEIYGNGLERGKSMNMFVMSSKTAVNEYILQGPSNVTAEKGKNVDLPCVVQRVRTRWWTKNKMFIGLTTKKITMFGSSSIRVNDVQLDDEGWYTCHAEAHNGDKSHASAYLKVIDPATPVPVIPTTSEPFIDKKKNDKIDIEDVRGFVTGTQVRIQWSVLGKMEALTKISKFIIEVQRSGAPNDTWLEADVVDSHVRATTIKNLIPDNKYQFRIRMIRDNGSGVISQPTNLMKVEIQTGDLLPVAPKIENVYQYTYDSAIVHFSHNHAIENAAAKTFVIVYSEIGNNKSLVTQVDGSQNDAIISDLHQHRNYTIRAIAENAAGKSVSSNEYLFNTTSPGMFSSVRVYFDALQPHLTFKNIALGGIVVTLSIIVLLVCFTVFCNLRTGKQKQNNQANGKFLDTSYRIFNEQKINKSKIFDNSDGTTEEDIDECSPLKIKASRDSDDIEKYGFGQDNGTLPNLYGTVDEDDEGDAQTGPTEATYASIQKIGGGGEYGLHNTARCYSPESRTSHEMLVSYSRSAAHSSAAHSSANSSSPQMNGSIQRVKAYNYPDSLLYSPAGTTFSITETSSSGNAARLDSPNHPHSDESDQGIRCGGSSRNSHISSSDGSKMMSMGTFKGSTPTSSFVSTFDRRRLENVA